VGVAPVRALRALIALTAAATVAVEVLNLGYAENGRWSLAVRTGWALLRAFGFLFLMREVRLGRLAARPFGLILAVTTMFAVARLMLPQSGRLVPPVPVLAGFTVLALLCATVVWLLYRSPAVDRHLTRKPPRRPVPPWVLTTRVACLSYAALVAVPCLVAVGRLFDPDGLPYPFAVPVLVAWFVLALVLAWLVPWATVLLVFGVRWVRWLLAAVTAVVLVVQPALCALLLGVDGLVRDGGPLAITALLALYGLWRTRGWRPAPARPAGVAPAART
jgi:hypothetical protein